MQPTVNSECPKTTAQVTGSKVTGSLDWDNSRPGFSGPCPWTILVPTSTHSPALVTSTQSTSFLLYSKSLKVYSGQPSSVGSPSPSDPSSQPLVVAPQGLGLTVLSVPWAPGKRKLDFWEPGSAGGSLCQRPHDRGIIIIIAMLQWRLREGKWPASVHPRAGDTGWSDKKYPWWCLPHLLAETTLSLTQLGCSLVLTGGVLAEARSRRCKTGQQAITCGTCQKRWAGPIRFSLPEELNWEMLSMGQQERETRSIYREKPHKVTLWRRQSYVWAEAMRYSQGSKGVMVGLR